MYTGRRALATAVAVACAAALAGCGTSPVAASDGRPTIVASMYPFAYLAAAIAGNQADVVTLVPPGTEPHDYALTPRQTALLGSAALVVYQKGVDAALDTAVQQASPARLVETGSLVTLLLASQDGADTTGETQADYAYDPHTWLDPANMVVFAGAIEAAVSAADPAHTPDYQGNLASLAASLQNLDAEFRSGLASCQRTTFITTHAAFGYLARAYGQTQLAIAGVTPDDEPSPKRLGELSQQAKALGITTVFFETLISPAYATTLADDLGLRTDVLDPLEGVTSASRGTDYPAIMRANLAALRQANGCG